MDINIQQYPISLPPVLLVEDDEVDTESFTRAYKKNNIPNRLYCAHDGVEALDFLRGENGKEKIAAPCVIFLDINMPRMNGFELLEEIRASNDTAKNTVFMLTTSAQQKDLVQAYDLNVAGYFVKSNMMKLTDLLARYLQCNEFATEETRADSLIYNRLSHK